MRVSPLVTLGNPQRRQLGCEPASRVLMKLLYKLKRAMRRHRNIPQYRYDLRSYCLNFSDQTLCTD
ncbi:hypothetical protein RYX36_031372 [Vicia faba]